jgi:hypothetical protein
MSTSSKDFASRCLSVLVENRGCIEKSAVDIGMLKSDFKKLLRDWRLSYGHSIEEALEKDCVILSDDLDESFDVFPTNEERINYIDNPEGYQND